MTEGVWLWLWRRDNDQHMWGSFKKDTRYLKQNRMIKRIAVSWWSPAPDFSPKERGYQRGRGEGPPPPDRQLLVHIWVRMLPIDVPDKGRVQNLCVNTPSPQSPSDLTSTDNDCVYMCTSVLVLIRFYKYSTCKVISRFQCPLSAPFWEACLW